MSRLADAAHVANAALERLDGADEILELHAETLQTADAIDEVCGVVHRLQAANQIFADRLRLSANHLANQREQRLSAFFTAQLTRYGELHTLDLLGAAKP